MQMSGESDSADGTRRCAKERGSGPLPRRRVSYRSTQDRRDWILGRLAPCRRDKHALRQTLLHGVDPADKESCRPDLAVMLYPGHLWVSTYEKLESNPDVPVTRQTPPTFLLQAENDDVDSINNSLVY